jgi:hypothetical protein
MKSPKGVGQAYECGNRREIVKRITADSANLRRPGYSAAFKNGSAPLRNCS